MLAELEPRPETIFMKHLINDPLAPSIPFFSEACGEATPKAIARLLRLLW